MTGMDVLERCRSYEQDVKRLRVKRDCAQDVLFRVTRATDAQGHGAAGDKMGSLTARKDELERGIEARKRAYAMELIEAMRLIGEIESVEVGKAMHSHYIEGESYDAIAVGIKASRDAVRSLIRRGREQIAGKKSRLPTRGDYITAREDENRANHPHRDPAWPPMATDGH